MNKIMRRLTVLIILAAIVTVCVAGCGFLDRVEAWKYGVEEGKGAAAQQDSQNQESQDAQQQAQADPNATSQEPDATQGQNNTVSLVPTSEAAGSLKSSENKVADQTQTTSETKKVSLYFSNAEGTGLTAVTAQIPKVDGIARATVNQLLAGPAADSGLLPTIPAGTTLKDINITSDGLCIVDFSSQLVDNYSGDLQNEELLVYSIVDTLTQFPTVKSVEIRVDGKQVKTIAGHMDVSETLARNESLIIP